MSIQFHLDNLEIDGLKQKISTLSTSTVHHRLLITCKDDDDNKFSITLSLDDVATILFYLLTQPGIPKNCSLKKLITAWMDTPAITCKDRTRIRYALDIDVLSAATDSSNSPSDSAPENQPSISEPNSHTSKTTGHQGQTTTDILEPTSPQSPGHTFEKATKLPRRFEEIPFGEEIDKLETLLSPEKTPTNSTSESDVNPTSKDKPPSPDAASAAKQALKDQFPAAEDIPPPLP